MTIVKDCKKGTFLFPSDDDIQRATEFISESMGTSIIMDGAIISTGSIIAGLDDVQLYTLFNLLSVVMNGGNNNIVTIDNAPEEITK